MKLQILIPLFDESYSVIESMLESIRMQRNLDMNEVGVVIVVDGAENPIPPERFANFPYQIDYIISTHAGVSATRNKCLERASADYVMFCDADDCFLSVNSICEIFNAIESVQNESPDGVIATFLEEIKSGKAYAYVPHVDDRTFVHGKVYRREFLLENGIVFDPKLTVHEDSYHTLFARSMSDKFVQLNIPVYLWCWRDESICRRDPKYILKTFTNLIDSNEALVKTFCKLKKMQDAIIAVTSMIYDTYFQLNKKDWQLEENKVYVDAVERRIAQYYSAFLPLYLLADDKIRHNVIVGVKGRMYQEGLFMEVFTFDDWIHKIEQIALNANVQ